MDHNSSLLSFHATGKSFLLYFIGHILTIVKYRLDGMHCVFGEMIEGENVLRQLELAGSRAGKTTGKLVVDDCGEVKQEPAK